MQQQANSTLSQEEKEHVAEQIALMLFELLKTQHSPSPTKPF